MFFTWDLKKRKKEKISIFHFEKNGNLDIWEKGLLARISKLKDVEYSWLWVVGEIENKCVNYIHVEISWLKSMNSWLKDIEFHHVNSQKFTLLHHDNSFHLHVYCETRINVEIILIEHDTLSYIF